MSSLIDALGRPHQRLREAASARIACLVPSITELLFELELGPQMVARTGFCIHPRDQVGDVPKVGGTKDVNLEKLRAQEPTHVIVNIDENRKDVVEAIARFVPHVIVTHPNAPSDNLQLYRLLGGIFRRESQAERLAQALLQGLERLSAQSWPTRRVLYCIWQDPWMTVAPDTYIGSMLALAGLRQHAFDGTERYPRFVWSDALAHQLDHVLLSSEPYRFTEEHADALERQLGLPVTLVDGEMLSWYGSRAIAGLDYLLECAKKGF